MCNFRLSKVVIFMCVFCRPRLKSSVVDVAGITKATGEFERGVFPYFMDGVLPMLTVSLFYGYSCTYRYLSILWI